jgi:hypothetical protein
LSWINEILICGKPCRVEQIKELTSGYIVQSDRIKYFSPQNGHNNNHNDHTSQTNQIINYEPLSFSRLAKLCVNHLKKEDDYDIVLVHDIKMPFICEETFINLTLQAVRHGACSMSTSPNIHNKSGHLFKIDRTKSIKNSSEESLQNFMLYESNYAQDFDTEYYLNADYKITYKPQAFQFSVFQVLIENVRMNLSSRQNFKQNLVKTILFKAFEEELSNDIDFVILAKKYADVDARLIYEPNSVSILKINHISKINFR